MVSGLCSTSELIWIRTLPLSVDCTRAVEPWVTSLMAVCAWATVSPDFWTV